MSSGKGNARPIVIVKRYKKAEAGHHGGAWKVAYADFVTAMMAFFLVLWLVTAVSKEQRAAIFDYFKNPSMEPGKSVKPAPGQMGPGGASSSPINLGGGLDAPRTTQSHKPGQGIPQVVAVPDKQAADAAADAKKIQEQALALQKAQAEIEKKHLESLMEDLKEAISKSQALEPFKDQLLLDITPEGLRIQIVDASNRPMFDIGSSKLKSYTTAIIKELTPYLNSVPNHVSITGHTDTTPYLGITGYTNWDLSADRANAARRALEGNGLGSDKVSRVVGLSSSVLFDKANPRNPINRRISLVVLTKEAEEQALKTDIPVQTASSSEPAAADSAGSEASVGSPSAATASSPPIVSAGETGGPIKAIDEPINPPMGTAPKPVPATASATAHTVAQAATTVAQATPPPAAPKYPLGQKKTP